MLEQRFNVGDANNAPLYTINIEDAPKEQRYEFAISTSNLGWSDGIHVSDVDAAVQAFADSVASVSSTAVATITKTTATTAAL
jgi:hypothetical protein